MNLPKPERDPRPWGEELWLTRESGAPAMVKIITVKPGESLSLQFHLKRDEFWFVISGDGTAKIGADMISLMPGVSCYVPKQVNHRITGGKQELTFLELAYGEFDENDIVRLEDNYGRATTKT